MGTSSNSLKRFNHLISEIDAVYHESSLKLGLSDSVSRILYTICNVGDSYPLHEIIRQTGLSKQTVHSAVHKLEEEGVLFLRPLGGKAKLVCLTEQGSRLAERTALRLIQLENDLLASWDPEDVQRYLSLTERFLEDLKERVGNLPQEPETL